MKLVEENMIRIKLFYIFFEKFLYLTEVFDKNSKSVTQKYKEVTFFKRLALKTELYLQDSFLEYNENIDNIIYSLEDKHTKIENIINKRNFFRLKIN
jgi:hypothetical protein